MTVLIWIVMIIMTFYTLGFSISLWRDKKKIGALAVLSIAIATIVSALFGVLK